MVALSAGIGCRLPPIRIYQDHGQLHRA
jgi:hypothetical protein